LNFLEVVSTEVTPASPRYLTDTGRHHSQQLEQVGSSSVFPATPDRNQSMVHSDRVNVTCCCFNMQSLCALADAVSEEEHEEIVAALQTSDAKRRLSQASTNVGGFSVKHASVIAKRISKHPFFQGCTRFKTRGRLQGAGHKPSPHQDPTANRKELYKYRVVLRFSADGHSPSHIDFYIPRLKDNGRFKFANVSGPDASLEIPSGQVCRCCKHVGQVLCCQACTLEVAFKLCSYKRAGSHQVSQLQLFI
jgi:hypothetical protein